MHRVLQWGTGNVGYHSLRHLIRHPDFELVGVHAFSASKIGRDAADLCGLRDEVGATGNPSVQLECFVRGEDGDHNTGGVQATAMRVINALPAVCAHAPGLISTLDLPYTPSTNLRSAK